MNWPNKKEREAFGIDGFIKAYALLPVFRENHHTQDRKALLYSLFTSFYRPQILWKRQKYDNI